MAERDSIMPAAAVPRATSKVRPRLPGLCVTSSALGPPSCTPTPNSSSTGGSLFEDSLGCSISQQPSDLPSDTFPPNLQRRPLEHGTGWLRRCWLKLKRRQLIRDLPSLLHPPTTRCPPPRPQYPPRRALSPGLLAPYAATRLFATSPTPVLAQAPAPLACPRSASAAPPASH